MSAHVATVPFLRLRLDSTSATQSHSCTLTCRSGYLEIPILDTMQPSLLAPTSVPLTRGWLVGAGPESPGVMLAASLPVLCLRRGHRGRRGQAWPRGLSPPQLEPPAATGGGGECVCNSQLQQPAAPQPPPNQQHHPPSLCPGGGWQAQSQGGRSDPIWWHFCSSSSGGRVLD